MATKTLTGPNGEVKTFKEITNGDETRWVEYTPPADGYQPKITAPINIPDGQPIPYGMSEGAISKRQSDIDKRNEYEMSLIGDEAAQKRKEIAEGKGFLENVYGGARNVIKQFNAGTSLSPDFLPSSIQDILDYRIGGGVWNEASRSGKESLKDMDMIPHNLQYQADRMESPLPTTIGELGMYMGTGAIGEKMVGNIFSKLSRANSKLNKKYQKATGQTREVQRGETIEPQIQDLLQLNAHRAARGTGAGALEGWADDSQSVLGGAGTSAIGGALGMVSPAKILDKVPTTKDPGHRAMTEEMYQNGFYLTPGKITDNKPLQIKEAGARNNDNISQEVYNKVDGPNTARLTTMLGEAIGLKTKGKVMLEQKMLNDHMAGLKKTFDDLESTTTGRLDTDILDRLKSLKDRIEPTETRNNYASAKETYGITKDILQQLNTNLKRNPDGGWDFNGASYKEISQRVKDQMNTAFKNNETERYKTFKELNDILDDTIKKGMGAAKLKKWENAREKFALSNMVMENGMEAHGKINPKGITSELLSKHEAANLLTGTGTKRKKKLQDIARFSAFLDDVEGGTLTGLGTADKMLTQKDRGLLTRGVDTVLTPYSMAKVNYMLDNFRVPLTSVKLSPHRGLPPTTMTKVQRDLAQASPYSDVLENLFEDTDEKYEDIKKRIDKMFGVK